MSDTDRAEPARFLALTAKYGWIVVEPVTPGWTGYWTVPGKYGIEEGAILDRAKLPPARSAS